MALGSQPIGAVRGCLQAISSAYSRIVEGNVSYKYVMENNDWSTFATDTNFGATVQEKVIKITQLIDGNLQEQVNDLIKKTNDFLDQQESTNNQSV